MFAFARSLALPAVLLAASGVIAVSPPAAATTAAATTLCGFQASPVGGDAYTVQNNEWGSTAPECISTDGDADFTVAPGATLETLDSTIDCQSRLSARASSDLRSSSWTSRTLSACESPDLRSGEWIFRMM